MQTLQKHTILLITILLWSCVSVFAADKYNGKEFDTEDNLNLYDYGARQYDPQLCRWTSQDALAEKITTKVRIAFVREILPCSLIQMGGN